MSVQAIVHKELSFKIIGIAMQVHKELGFGFFEKVYENAVMMLFRKEFINAIQQAPITVSYRGEIVGEYLADVLVEGQIILELKSAAKINDAHRAQALNYLKATGKKLAIILNFGKESLEYERVVQ